jgi:hypothetical protein
MIVARLTSHKLSVFLGLGHSRLGSAKHEICADYMLPSFVGGVLVSRKKRTNKETKKQINKNKGVAVVVVVSYVLGGRNGTPLLRCGV